MGIVGHVVTAAVSIGISLIGFSGLQYINRDTSPTRTVSTPGTTVDLEQTINDMRSLYEDRFNGLQESMQTMTGDFTERMQTMQESYQDRLNEVTTNVNTMRDDLTGRVQGLQDSYNPENLQIPQLDSELPQLPEQPSEVEGTEDAEEAVTGYIDSVLGN